MEHVPVLLKESINGLNIKTGGTYVDGTLGRGGHTREIALKLKTGQIIAIECDGEAIDETRGYLSEHEELINCIHGNFRDIGEILDSQGISCVDGMLFDLGVSSPQLDIPERGFSYMKDAPLDGRMDKRSSLTAFDIVNIWSEERLRQIFYEYGEERYARTIARSITRKREKAPIATTFELNEIIIAAMPAPARREKQHPARRCYQAIRLAVNSELEALEVMLAAAPDRLKAGGRICVISYHSLEDRLVKSAFAKRVNSCECPKSFPVCICGIPQTLKLITKKPIVPDSDERERNPRARSAKLRIAERI